METSGSRRKCRKCGILTEGTEAGEDVCFYCQTSVHDCDREPGRPTYLELLKDRLKERKDVDQLRARVAELEAEKNYLLELREKSKAWHKEHPNSAVGAGEVKAKGEDVTDADGSLTRYLISRVESLHAENAKLRRLLVGDGFILGPPHGCLRWFWSGHWHGKLGEFDTPDAAIDAALKEMET